MSTKGRSRVKTYFRSIINTVEGRAERKGEIVVNPNLDIWMEYSYLNDKVNLGGRGRRMFFYISGQLRNYLKMKCDTFSQSENILFQIIWKNMFSFFVCLFIFFYGCSFFALPPWNSTIQWSHKKVLLIKFFPSSSFSCQCWDQASSWKE